MTCKRQFACDLCHFSLADGSEGIGVRWEASDKIKAIYLLDSEHHLCNKCCAGLRAMFADLDRMQGSLDALAADVERERAQ